MVEIWSRTLILGCADDGSVSLDCTEGVNFIGDYAFYGNEALHWFNANGALGKIGAYAFSGCKNVTEIGIYNGGNGLKEIGSGAFSGCSSLQYMKLCDSVTQIGMGILEGCTSLKKVYIGTGITEIPEYTFSGCTNLTKIEPHIEQGYLKNVKSIGAYAFENCQSLTEIPLPNGLETIHNGAFVNCFQLKYLEIPEQVTEIGEMVFSWCYSLETLTVEDGNQTFIAKDGCVIEVSTKTLVAITANAEIPSDGSVEVIADGVFTGHQQADVIIPEGVKEIGTSAFRGNWDLKSVSIPHSVKEIKDNVFMDCWPMETIYYNGTVAEWKQLMQNYSWMTWSELTVKCTDGEICIICSNPAKG